MAVQKKRKGNPPPKPPLTPGTSIPIIRPIFRPTSFSPTSESTFEVQIIVSKNGVIRFKDATKRKKISEYGMQLREKQKMKFIYGVLEKQFLHYFLIASRMEGKTGDNLFTLLESRLDNVVFRMGLALTRKDARQLVTHAHFTVNGQKRNDPSYRVKVGDVIALREKERTSDEFKAIVETTADRAFPRWLEVKKDEFSAKIIRMPSADDVDYEINLQLIVDLYSE